MGKNWRQKRAQSQPDKFRKFKPKSKWQRAAQSRLLNKLTPRDWSGVTLEEVKKDFYQEHPNVKARDQARIKEYMDQNRISVKGQNCPKPVEAFDEFGFPDCVMDAVKALNFVKPTPIQSQAIPVALSGRNMVGIADTGSGKTLAFILPAITHILGNNHPRNIGEPEVVVLAPTRELAQQIQQVVLSLGPGINVKSECFYGGTDRMEQKEVTEKVFEICIATPGRMVDFLSEGYVKLHRCAFFVLDEADRMLDMGFAPQIKRVIGQSRPDRHMLMFSATWPPEIQELAETYLKDYILVNIGSLEISANHNITQKVEFCENDDKPQRIVKIMKQVMQEEENKTLIFVNIKVDVDLLTLQFRLNGWEAMGLHGGKKQAERDRVFNDFKTGKISILIATDLAARGLDVDDIKYIINYDYPHSPEDYVHRIGRTARCNRTGTAITLFSQKDRDQAKHLISVLEEAGQHVPPHLRKMLALPPPTRSEKKGKLVGTTKVNKKHLKKFMKQKNVNSVPLGPTVNSDKLIGVEDIVGLNVLNEIEASKNKKKKRKAANKVEATESLPSFNKKAKTDIQSGSLHTDSSNRFMGDHYSGNFENTQWAPSSNSQKYEENSRNTFARNMGNANPPAAGNVNIQNPDLGLKGREIGHSPELPFNERMSAGDRRGNNMYSADHKNTSMPMNSRNYETSMGPRGLGSSMDAGKYDSYYQRESNVYPTDYRNTNMPMNSGNYETPTGPLGSRTSVSSGKYDDSYVRRESNVYSTDYRNTTSGISGKHDDSYVQREGNVYSTDNGNTASMTSGKHDDSYLGRYRNAYPTDHRNTTSVTSRKYDDPCVRKEKNVYSMDYRNTNMSTNSRNYETPTGSSGSGFSMAGGKYDDSSAGYRNTSMTMNSRNYEASMGARGSGSSTFDARSHAGVSFDQRQSDAGGDGAEGRQNSNYKNTHDQTSDWGSSRNSYSMNRMDMNRYPGQNQSGRGGFNRY